MIRINYRTPGTRLWWSNVQEWCTCAWTLERRRLSAKRNRDIETHAICVPLEMIKIESDLDAIEQAVELYKHGPKGIRRPQRGHRGEHGSTPIIVALQNRAAVLRREADALPKGENWSAVQGEKSA